jgi:hypothetical protein
MKAKANTKAKLAAKVQAEKIYKANINKSRKGKSTYANAMRAHRKAEASIKTTKKAATAAHNAFLNKLMARGNTAPVAGKKAVKPAVKKAGPCVKRFSFKQIDQIFKMISGSTKRVKM